MCRSRWSSEKNAVEILGVSSVHHQCFSRYGNGGVMEGHLVPQTSPIDPPLSTSPISSFTIIFSLLEIDDTCY